MTFNVNKCANCLSDWILCQALDEHGVKCMTDHFDRAVMKIKTFLK